MIIITWKCCRNAIRWIIIYMKWLQHNFQIIQTIESECTMHIGATVMQNHWEQDTCTITAHQRYKNITPNSALNSWIFSHIFLRILQKSQLYSSKNFAENQVLIRMCWERTNAKTTAKIRCWMKIHVDPDEQKLPCCDVGRQLPCVWEGGGRNCDFTWFSEICEFYIFWLFLPRICQSAFCSTLFFTLCSFQFQNDAMLKM